MKLELNYASLFFEPIPFENYAAAAAFLDNAMHRSRESDGFQCLVYLSRLGDRGRYRAFPMGDGDATRQKGRSIILFCRNHEHFDLNGVDFCTAFLYPPEYYNIFRT